MVSIADVARHAGVSPTTVSHTISGKRKVSDSIRESVQRSMQELSYVPSRAAQNLALGSTRVIALVVPDIAIEYFAALAKSIEATAVERGYNLMLATTGFDVERETRYLEMIASRAVDGIVYASGATLGKRARKALVGGLPVILVDEEVDGVELRTIVSDNEQGGRLVADHLLQLGHRNVLEIQGQHDPLTSVRRSAGFASVWSAGGGVASQTQGDYSADAGAAAIDRYASEFAAGNLTAVFAHNDVMALGAINQLRALGLSVPADVSMVGFDDVSPGRYSFPQLTTVRQDVATLGGLAATALLDALKSADNLPPQRTVLPVELITRASTATVRT